MRYLRVCAFMLCINLVLAGTVYAAPDTPQQKPAKTDARTTASKPRQTKATQASTKATKIEKAHNTPHSSAKKSRRISLSHGGDPLVGKASWYGSKFHGGKTASGVTYDKFSYTAAHRTLPLGTVVAVHTEDAQSVLVCINNRGPFIAGRVIDLSHAAAQDIGLDRKGILNVRLIVVSDEHGKVTESGKAFYVRLAESAGKPAHRLGPFTEYADASVMRDVLRPKHADVRVTLETL